MGTHSSGPAVVDAGHQEQTLKAWLDNHPEALGDRVVQRFGPDLPFLFKVHTHVFKGSAVMHKIKSVAKYVSIAIASVANNH